MHALLVRIRCFHHNPWLSQLKMLTWVVVSTTSIWISRVVKTTICVGYKVFRIFFVVWSHALCIIDLELAPGVSMIDFKWCRFQMSPNWSSTVPLLGFNSLFLYFIDKVQQSLTTIISQLSPSTTQFISPNVFFYSSFFFGASRLWTSCFHSACEGLPLRWVAFVFH